MGGEPIVGRLGMLLQAEKTPLFEHAYRKSRVPVLACAA
jgi:hypothetical protein